MAQCSVQQCEICERASGIHFCIDCDKKFCEDCKNQHKRIKTTKFHRFQGSRETISKANWKFEKHADEFRFVCRSCNVLLCSVCVTEKHNGHTLFAIKELLQQTEKVFKEKLIVLGQHNEHIQTGIALFESRFEEVVAGIRSQGEKIKYIVDQHIEKIIDQLRKEVVRERMKMEEFLKDTENFQKKGN